MLMSQDVQWVIRRFAFKPFHAFRHNALPFFPFHLQLVSCKARTMKLSHSWGSLQGVGRMHAGRAQEFILLIARFILVRQCISRFILTPDGSAI
jgi:hypothetical protein